jgi:NADH:quinone reductase (non-electrogenic)
VKVNDDLSVPGYPDVFVIGDMMNLNNLPGVAQVAMQGGKYVAGVITRRLRGEPAGGPFKYFDKGSMATISRFHAVCSIGSRIRFAGFTAWLMWLAVHVMYLIGFKNRLTTMLHWAVSFVFRGRSQRTTTRQQIVARTLMAKLSATEEELSEARAAMESDQSAPNGQGDSLEGRSHDTVSDLSNAYGSSEKGKEATTERRTSEPGAGS